MSSVTFRTTPEEAVSLSIGYCFGISLGLPLNHRLTLSTARFGDFRKKHSVATMSYEGVECNERGVEVDGGELTREAATEPWYSL